MSKKASQAQPVPQAGAGGGVDFLVRTMIERESTGKRPIRPKNVEDLLQSTIQDESDDPDFDCEDEDSDSAGSIEESEASNDSKAGDENGDDDSDESDDEDYQEKNEADQESGSDSNSDANSSSGSDDDEDESSNEDSQGSDSDEEDSKKKSALRETLEKLNEANDFPAKRPVKRKRKNKKNSENARQKKGAAKTVKAKNPKSSAKAKSASVKKSAKTVGKKVSKAKKVVLGRKAKLASKKSSTEKKKRKEKSEPKRRSIFSLIESASISQKENRNQIEVSKPICSHCLGDKSDDLNEIVECDSCGISVHEGCYGISQDNVSISSGSGSSSCTEPWFCDVCKSGIDTTYCELCPVKGGLFKESKTGRWVHLVCAMYTQGVVVHNDSSIDLLELHYTRWGAHSCAACDDERQAHTGIVIPCDAGMCKTYFHATCAQQLGLLSDLNQVDFTEADPYYLSCKLHTNRETMKRRIRLFNTLQEQLRIKKERKETEGLPSESNTDQARILRKLNKVRQKTALRGAQYLTSLERVPLSQELTDQVGDNLPRNLPSSWTSGSRKQRLLHTSAKFGDDFVRKMDRLGDDLPALQLEAKHERIVTNVRKKHNVLPAMSVEFSAYYADREDRINSLVEQYEQSVKENEELMDKEIALKDVWETHMVNQMAMSEETESVSQTLESLANILTYGYIGEKKLTSKLHSMVKPKELSGGRRKSPNSSRSESKSPKPRRSSAAKKSNKNRVLSPSPSRPAKLAVAVCDTCSKSDRPHLITRCDKCKRNYHLSCLDPPLTRMPKRSRLCGWMCSDCCEGPPENTESGVDTEAPRTLRGRTKIHKPRKYRGSDDSDNGTPEADNSKSPPPKRSQKTTPSALSSPEIKVYDGIVNTITASSPVALPASSPTNRRRRSGSNVPVAPVSNLFPSVPHPVVNGPQITDHPANVIASNTSLDSPVALNIPLPPDILSKPKKKRIASTTKTKTGISKAKRPKNEDGALLDSPLKVEISRSPALHIKVNGMHDSTASEADAENSVSISPKKPRKRKIKLAADVKIGDEVKSEIVIPDSNGIIVGVDKVKVKKPRKKKTPDGSTAGQNKPVPILEVKQDTDSMTTAKVKKTRKKKEVPNAIVQAPNGPTEVDKKKPKKIDKQRNSSSLMSPPIAAHREENVAQCMEKVTSQLFDSSKLKGLQNGTAKITKKRKSSSSVSSTLTQVIPTSPPVNTEEKEKDKSVPPKKRKRISSNAQMQGPPNNVDSIIEAVSSGGLENGRCDMKPAEPSTLLQGISSMSRQLAPEQHQSIMQGKQMGSGINSGEMVTVDTSFLLDGPASSESSYSMNSSVHNFYSSTNHNSRGLSQHENSMTLSSGGSTNESGNSENVIRLQYIDAPTVSIPDSSSMPPPAPLSSSSNVYASTSVCAKCTKTDSKIQLVMCDKCHLEFHFQCLDTPMRISPKRKGHPWFCSDCDDGESQAEYHRNK